MPLYGVIETASRSGWGTERRLVEGGSQCFGERARRTKGKSGKNGRVDVVRAEEREEAERFAKTPAGRARTAREEGARLFQITLPLSKSSTFHVSMVGVLAKSEESVHEKRRIRAR